MADLFGATATGFSGNPKAYAAAPGSGPEGKTCADCEHHYVSGGQNPNKAFHKCALVAVTHGAATDIRVRTPACRLFKPEERATP